MNLEDLLDNNSDSIQLRIDMYKMGWESKDSLSINELYDNFIYEVLFYRFDWHGQKLGYPIKFSSSAQGITKTCFSIVTARAAFKAIKSWQDNPKNTLHVESE